MSHSNIETSFRGDLLFSTPPIPQAPRWLAVLAGLFFMAVGLLLIIPLYENLSISIRRLFEVGVMINVGLIVVLSVVGFFLIYKGFNYVPMQDDLFYSKGFEFGYGEDRAFVPYVALEQIDWKIKTADEHVRESGFRWLRAAISVAAMNPAGVGRAIAESRAPTIHSIATWKPRGSKAVTFQFTQEQHDALSSYVGTK